MDRLLIAHILACLTGATLRRRRRADVGTDDSVGGADGDMRTGAGGVGASGLNSGGGLLVGVRSDLSKYVHS
jgi:hypothetical protein